MINYRFWRSGMGSVQLTLHQLQIHTQLLNKCQSTQMPGVTVFVKRGWLFKGHLYFSLQLLMDVHSSSLSFSLHWGSTELGKFFLSPMGSRPHFSRDVQHGLAWLVTAHMFPGLWKWYCSTSGVMKVKNWHQSPTSEDCGYCVCSCYRGCF